MTIGLQEILATSFFYKVCLKICEVRIACFFNTRIVRITEAFLFASNLYANLGVPKDAKLIFRVTHDGLAGRTLTSSGPSRMLLPSTTQASHSTTENIIVLGEIKDKLVDNVRHIAEPLFMLFDFQKFDFRIYEDIVQQFEQGKAT